MYVVKWAARLIETWEYYLVKRYVCYKLVNMLLTMPSNALPLHLNQTFPHIIWIFTEGEGDGIECKLPLNFISTLKVQKLRSLQYYSKRMNKPYMLTLQGGFWKMEKLVKPLRALKTSGFNFEKWPFYNQEKLFGKIW